MEWGALPPDHTAVHNCGEKRLLRQLLCFSPRALTHFLVVHDQPAVKFFTGRGCICQYPPENRRWRDRSCWFCPGKRRNDRKSCKKRCSFKVTARSAMSKGDFAATSKLEADNTSQGRILKAGWLYGHRLEGAMNDSPQHILQQGVKLLSKLEMLASQRHSPHFVLYC